MTGIRLKGSTAAQIAASLETQLVAGVAASGAQLPTVRGLARKLGVSPATAAAAYKLLRSRGLTSGSGRRGTRVAGQPELSAQPALHVPEGGVDLASGNPDPALLPPLEPALRMLDPGRRLLYDRGSVDGALRAFAATEFDADGIPDRAMAVVSGALDAMDRILREHLRVGDRIALEDPSFPGVIDLATASGYVPIPFELDEQGPRADTVERALRRGCHAIVITPRAQNPTGAVIGKERAADLRRVMRRWPELVVIENDYLAPIAGAPVFPLRTGPKDRWAVVRSTSKFLGPDLRVAVMAGDEVTIARVRARQALGMRWVSHLLQQLVLGLWSDPSSGRRLARATEIYAQRRRALQTALSGHGIDTQARSGFNVWVPVRDEAHVVHALANRGWTVAPGERFRIRSGPGIRITASMLEPPDAARFAADLAQVRRPSGSTLA